MKNTTKTLFLLAFLVLAGCGPSDEEKNKTIESAAAMRAQQVCQNSNGSLDDYGKYLAYLTEQLTAQGITGQKDQDKAIELFDQKIKAACPDKMPK